jgi:hypothetical protein
MRGASKVIGVTAGTAVALVLLLGLGFGGKAGARDARAGARHAVPLPEKAGAPEYTIRAVRYATIPGFPLADLVMGAPGDKKIDIAMVFWVIQGGGHTILFDSGFHREKWIKEFGVTDYLAPDEAVKEAGVTAASVTDIIVSHAHWDHMGGIDLFPNATIWI